MCIIIAKPKGVGLPKDEWLRNSASNNDDGMGVMYKLKDGNSIRIKKDFDNAETLVSWVKDNITKDDTIVFHFRLATSGLTDIGNRHPFPITNNSGLLRQPDLVCRQAMCHNGVLSDYSGHKKFNDTQKFVLDILCDPAVRNNFGSKVIRKLLAHYIDGDKLAILSITSGLILLGEYEKEEGLYFSNTTYKEKRYRYAGYNWRHSHWSQRGSSSSVSSVEKAVEQSHIWTHCDGCKSHKSCLKVTINASDLWLCKKCRKKARKALKAQNKQQALIDGADVNEVGNCEYCLKECKVIDMKVVWGDSKVCPDCFAYGWADGSIALTEQKTDETDCRTCQTGNCQDCDQIDYD
jgi:predicted glutamine amidotransferase